MTKIPLLLAAALALPAAAAQRPTTPVETIVFETGPASAPAPSTG